MVEELQKSCREEPPTPIFFNPGDLCAAQFSEDSCWYRAKVEEIVEGEVSLGGWGSLGGWEILGGWESLGGGRVLGSGGWGSLGGWGRSGGLGEVWEVGGLVVSRFFCVGGCLTMRKIDFWSFYSL